MPPPRQLWVVLALAGCATPMTALREDNQRLTHDVAQLRADKRAHERKIRDLEHQLALARAQDAAVPQLPVEVVAPPAPSPSATLPDGGRVVGTTDDGGEIIYEGDAAAGKPATLDDDPPPRRTATATVSSPSRPRPLDDIPQVTDRLEVTHVSARGARPHVRAASPPAGDASANGDYRAAVELVRSAKYDDALAALRAFLQRYPHHELADNAQYWVGEVYYARKDFEHALVEFRATIESYPHGNKVPDALLKVGYCYQALGQADKARAVLEQVVNLYSKSEPAALAAKRLESK